MNEALDSKEKLSSPEEIPLEVNQIPEAPQKRIFIGLLAVTCVILGGLAYFLWWVPNVGLHNIHPYLPAILA
ncbi:MAG: hypothetical protein PVH57_11985, partial [Syntrophobacterales bacterium]